MASIFWKSSIAEINNPPWVELVVNQTSQSVDGNYSVLTYSLILHRPGQVYSTSSKSYNVVINGVTVASGTTTLGGIGDKIVASGTTNVPHNADGTKTGVGLSFTMQIGITWSGVYTGDASASGTMNLTPIPRASTGSLSNMNPFLGDTVTINIVRATPSFKHDVFVDWYAGTWTKLNGTTKIDTSMSWTVPKSFANFIPSSMSGNGRIAIDTYNDTTYIGTSIFTFTGNINPADADFKPTISSVPLSEAVAGIASQFGSYVQNKSKVTGTVTASGKYSATIIGISTTIAGEKYTNNPFTSKEITASGTVQVSTIVTDSRGQTAVFNQNISVAPYSSPVITQFTPYRSLDDGTVDDDDGTYLTAMVGYTISPVNIGGVNKNTSRYQLQYKQVGSSTWVDVFNVPNIFMLADAEMVSGGPILDESFAYNVRLLVTDYFGSVPSEDEIGSAFTLADFHADGRHVAFGKISEGRETVEVYGGILVQNRGLDTKIYIEQLEGNAGLEIGNPELSGLAYVDFHSSGTGSDYDARIIAMGGNSTDGQGTLILEGQVSFSKVPLYDSKNMVYVESYGTNVNGTYIMYSDGTMFCYFKKFITTTSTGVYDITFTYPASFYSSPWTVAQLQDAGSQSWIGTIVLGTNSTTSVRAVVWGANPNMNHYLNYIAIGRWK